MRQRLVFTLFLALVLSAPGLVVGSELFPIPRGLESHIKFWIDVYTRYNVHDYVIHDAWDLTKIYEVVDASKAGDGYLSGWSLASREKEKFYDILIQFAEGRASPGLSPDHARVFRLWGRSSDPETFRRAAENLRIQQGLRENFEAGLRRTGRYMKQIRAIFHKYGIPKEISILPQVESCFNVRAYSRIGAAGMWQFTPYTGQLFLNVGYDVDERLDPIKATEAAAKLLKRNYEITGSWPLAITAYNHGALGMKQAKEQLGTDDFAVIHRNYKSPSFRFASRNFYLEFLAAKHIFENYRLYFGKIDFDQPEKYIEYPLPDEMMLSDLAAELGLDVETVAELNPALRPPVLRSEKPIPAGVSIRLPYSKRQLVRQKLGHKTGAPSETRPPRWRYYRIRPGETLHDLATRLGTTPMELIALNNLEDPFGDYQGRIIRIPGDRTLAKVSSAPAVDARDRETRQPISNDDALAVRDQNRPSSEGHPAYLERVEKEIPTETDFQPQTPSVDFTILEVAITEPSSGWIRAYPNETMGHYAAWLKVPIHKLLMVNRMQKETDLRPGQRVRLLFDRVSSEEFHQLRLEYHRGLQEDFFEHFQVVGTRVYKLKEGEHIWDLCLYEFQVPCWLVMQYNAGKDLLRVQPGDEIVIPEVIEKKG